MDIIQLQKDIKQKQKELFELETQLATLPTLTLMYRITKGKHTFVFQPTKQLEILQTNGWERYNIDDFLNFVNEKIS